LLKHYFFYYPSQADSEAIQGVEELNRSLALDPNNQKVQDLIKVINRFKPSIIVPDSNGYVFLAAVPPASTATRAFQPSSTSPLAPTEVSPTPIAPTSVEMAIVQAATPTPPPESEPQPTPPNLAHLRRWAGNPYAGRVGRDVGPQNFAASWKSRMSLCDLPSIVET
jgi:hypothetical protein